MDFNLCRPVFLRCLLYIICHGDKFVPKMHCMYRNSFYHWVVGGEEVGVAVTSSDVSSKEDRYIS